MAVLEGKIIGNASKVRPIKRIDYAADDKPGAFDSNTSMKLAVARTNGLFDEQGFIDEMYQNFLDAIQNHAPRIMTYPTRQDWINAGCPTWNGTAKFREFIGEAMLTCEYRLEEIKEKKKSNMPLILYSSVGDYLNKVQHGLDEFQPSDNAMMYSSDPEVLELQLFTCKKNIETCRKFMQGKLTVTNPEVTDDVIEKGLGLENWDDGRKEDIIKQIKAIPQTKEVD